MDSEYEVRDLHEKDYENGFIDILSELTVTGDITKVDFLRRLELMKSTGCYFVKVIVRKCDSKVVGAGTLVLEYKFIHGCSMKGHIEDIVIDESLRGKHFGKVLVEDLIDLSKKLGCYKTALCCREGIIGFYRKCGAEPKGAEMVIYHDK